MIKSKISSRRQAGLGLASRLKRLLKKGEPAVAVSLPRGGVPVGLAVAERLGCPHDIVVARKVAEERRPEWSVGAVADDGSTVWSAGRLAAERPAYLKKALAAQRAEARRRLRLFRRAAGPAKSLRGRTAVIVDDGAARGWTVLAAVAAVRRRGARRVIVALPVSSRAAARRIAAAADALVVSRLPERFYYVGSFYAKGAFEPIADQEVARLLRAARKP